MNGFIENMISDWVYNNFNNFIRGSSRSIHSNKYKTTEELKISLQSFIDELMTEHTKQLLTDRRNELSNQRADLEDIFPQLII